MNYWLCVTSEENWGVVNNKGVWGVSQKDRVKINKVEEGDLLIFYVKQIIDPKRVTPPRITGIFKAASKTFVNRKSIFKQGTFPLRVKLDPVIIPEKPLEFKPLIPKLEFIKNKKKWMGSLRQVMRTIPKEDFDLIKSSMK